MSSESNFSFTTKINGDLFTVRGDSVDEFMQHLFETASVEANANLWNILKGKGPVVPAAPTSTAEAIDNIEQAFGPVTVVSDTYVNTPAAPAAAPMAEKMDKFGNKYVQGSPGTDSCAHGPRVLKYGTSKAGKKYKAQVCVNDSPFGDWKQDKCETVWG